MLGPSGIGKTTLVRVMAGLDAPARGRVTIAGDPVRAGMVGVVHQSYPLFAHRSVLGNLLVAARGPDPEARAHTLLERFGLADHMHAWPCELSGGQRQRIAILQQLLCGHMYVLLDEPFSGLDPLSRNATCELLEVVDPTPSPSTGWGQCGGAFSYGGEMTLPVVVSLVKTAAGTREIGDLNINSRRRGRGLAPLVHHEGHQGFTKDTKGLARSAAPAGRRHRF